MDFESKQIVYMSSVNRKSGTSSNFLYSFNIENDKNYDHIAVLQASIPKSYYLINTNNDQWVLTENLNSVNISIPNGNYTLTAWKNTLISLLNSNSPHGWTYSVSFPTATTTNTGHLLFTVSGNGGLQPSFTFSETLYQQFGFNSGTYQFSANELESVNVINLQLIPALFIHSDIVNNKYDCVLQDVYSNRDDFSFITYQATEVLAYSKELSYKNNFTNRFFLTDDVGNEVNLQGLEWNMTLIFFKKNNTLDLIKNYIKLSLIQ